MELSKDDMLQLLNTNDSRLSIPEPSNDVSEPLLFKDKFLTPENDALNDVNELDPKYKFCIFEKVKSLTDDIEHDSKFNS